MHRFRLLPALPLLLFAPSALAGPAAAQIIPIRTAPIARADVFEFLPAPNPGMGGVSIAPVDTLGYFSVNPATGARIAGARFFASPVVYAVSHRSGSGSALPLGVVARSGAWFGGGALALQSVEPGRTPDDVFFEGPLRTTTSSGPGGADVPRGSAYALGLLGRTWSGRGVSLAGSVLAGRRGAEDGIALLYGESERVRSSGRVAVFRLGLLGEWAGERSLEAVAVHSRRRMTHDVRYADLYWDPDQQRQVADRRDERNADRADVWGLHVVHARPLAPGWRVGWVVTGNRVRYPRLPGYDVPRDGIMDLPSGRGDAWAWNLGVGLATDDGPVRLAIDAVYEPVWSRVWGEADAPVATGAGDTIPAGGTTVENRLRFSNAVLRAGGVREWPLHGPGGLITLEFGVAARLVDYRVARFDHRLAAGRDRDERWLEWTPTWGTALRLRDIELRYHGSVAYGTKRPGVAAGPIRPDILRADVLSIPPGPRDASALEPVGVVTQQLFISVPLRRGSGGGGTP